jgi:hypothetical protein
VLSYKYIYNEICDSYHYRDYSKTDIKSNVCDATVLSLTEGCIYENPSFSGRGFLFDLEQDPYESTDISKENPQIVEDLHVGS